MPAIGDRVYIAQRNHIGHIRYIPATVTRILPKGSFDARHDKGSPIDDRRYSSTGRAIRQGDNSWVEFDFDGITRSIERKRRAKVVATAIRVIGERYSQPQHPRPSETWSKEAFEAEINLIEELLEEAKRLAEELGK